MLRTHRESLVCQVIGAQHEVFTQLIADLDIRLGSTAVAQVCPRPPDLPSSHYINR